jgi:hypothetical protein
MHDSHRCCAYPVENGSQMTNRGEKGKERERDKVLLKMLKTPPIRGRSDLGSNSEDSSRCAKRADESSPGGNRFDPGNRLKTKNRFTAHLVIDA